MDARACGPAEPEKTDRDAEAADESRRKAFFGFEFAIFIELGFDYLVEVVEKWWNDEDCTEENSNER